MHALKAARSFAHTVPITLFTAACPSTDGTPAPSPTQGEVGHEVTRIDPRIWCIHEAENGDLWFGSDGNGVYRYDGRRVVHHGGEGDQVRDIEEDGMGNILVATTEGVTLFDGRDWTELTVETPVHGEGWVLDPADVWLVVDPGRGGPCRYDGEKLYRLELPENPALPARRAESASFPPGGIYSIYRDRGGSLWFGTAAAGICRFDGAGFRWMYEERLTTTPDGGEFGVRSVFEDRAGDFWICNTRQRFRISPETSQAAAGILDYEKVSGLPDARHDEAENFAYYLSMTEGVDGSLWMACGSDGVWKYDGTAIERNDLGEGVYASCVTRGRDGTLWAGTLRNGIHVFDDGRFARWEPFE